jgi:hypothetical protein
VEGVQVILGVGLDPCLPVGGSVSRVFQSGGGQWATR